MKNSVRVTLCFLALVLFSAIPFSACGSAEPDKVAEGTSATATDQSNRKGKPDIKVWVNTASDVYHCPGTRWYGNTKHGEFMTQKQAQDKGNRPAYGNYCY